MHICVKGFSLHNFVAQKPHLSWKQLSLCNVFSSLTFVFTHIHSGTSKKYIIKVNNTKIF